MYVVGKKNISEELLVSSSTVGAVDVPVLATKELKTFMLARNFFFKCNLSLNQSDNRHYVTDIHVTARKRTNQKTPPPSQAVSLCKNNNACLNDI